MVFTLSGFRRLPKAVLARVALAAGGAIFATVLLLQLWRSVLPSFGPAQYSYSGPPDRSAPLPLDVPSEGSLLRVRTTMKVGTIHPSVLSITPDDCLEALTVNEHRVVAPHSICLDNPGALYVGDLLAAGDNALEFVIKDQGGRGGVHIGVSITDPLFLTLIGLSAALVSISWILACRWLGHSTTGWVLLAIAIVALAVRLPLILSPGYLFDIRLNAHWAKSAAILGVGSSYTHQIGEPRLPNYPPLQLAIFAAAGRVYNLVISPSFDTGLADCVAFMKLPAIAADVVIAILTYLFVRKWRSPESAIVAALIYAMQPGIWYESAVWGQVDSIFALAALTSLIAACTRRWTVMGAFAALALLTKLQAMVILPTLGLVCILEPRAIRPAAIGSVLGIIPGVALVHTSDAFAALKDVYLHSAGFFPVLSMYAYNVWIALFGLAARDRPDTDLLFGLTSYRNVGSILFAIFALLLPVLGARKIRRAGGDSTRTEIIFWIPALTTYSFFLFNTEMHERYVFLLIPLGLIATVLSRRGTWPYVVASVLFFMNMLGALPWKALDRALFKELPNLPAVIGVCNVGAFAAMLAGLVRARRRA